MPVGVLSLEFLVHAWGFAMATSRQVVVSEPASEYVMGLAGKVIIPQARDNAGYADPAETGGTMSESSIDSSPSPADNRPLPTHPAN